MISPQALHYFAVGLAIALGAIGAGIGQGFAAFGSLRAVGIQLQGRDQIFRSMIIGLAFIESGIILTLVITLMLLFGQTTKINEGIAIAEIGIALMIGLSSTVISIASSFAVSASANSISRQPIFANKILTFMLVSQSLIEASIIFSFVISLLIVANFSLIVDFYIGFKYFCAALVMMLGSIGPGIGQGIFANSSCASIGMNRDAYPKLFPFSIINGAVIETPLIFSLLTSLLIIYLPITSGDYFTNSVVLLTAAFTIGIGSIGPSISNGLVGSKSVMQIVYNPDNYAALFRSNILAQAFIESAAIYCLIISLTLLTVFIK